MTWDIENFLQYLACSKDLETDDNLVSSRDFCQKFQCSHVTESRWF